MYANSHVYTGCSMADSRVCREMISQRKISQKCGIKKSGVCS